MGEEVVGGLRLKGRSECLCGVEEESECALNVRVPERADGAEDSDAPGGRCCGVGERACGRAEDSSGGAVELCALGDSTKLVELVDEEAEGSDGVGRGELLEECEEVPGARVDIDSPYGESVDEGVEGIAERGDCVRRLCGGGLECGESGVDAGDDRVCVGRLGRRVGQLVGHRGVLSVRDECFGVAAQWRCIRSGPKVVQRASQRRNTRRRT